MQFKYLMAGEILPEEKQKTLRQLKMKYKNIIQRGNSNVTCSVVITFKTFFPSKEEILQGALMGIWVQSIHSITSGNPKGNILYSQKWKQDSLILKSYLK